MGDVVPIAVRNSSVRASCDQALVEAAIDVLGRNEDLARAVQELALGFVRLDEAIAQRQAVTPARGPIDAILDQDRQKLLASMSDLLGSIAQYTGGMTSGIQRTLERQDGAPDV